MRLVRRLLSIFAILALAFVLAPPAFAGGLTAADQAAVTRYNLTEDFLERALALARDAATQPTAQPQLDLSGVTSLDDMAAKLEAEPSVHDLLVKHGFTAKDYLVGTAALGQSMLAARLEADPAQAGTLDRSKFNDANVAFYRTHQDKVALLMAMLSAGQ
ncbi:MAG: hypothetical protein ACOY3L_01090 [Pseudomonadota bacterium]